MAALSVDRTLVLQVVRLLRKRIILGELAPGERLIEVRLANELEVSRSTLREALRRLEAESLIESRSHRGSRVASLLPSDAVEICELHALLATHALRQTRLPFSRQLRDQLGDIVAQMRQLQFPDDVDRFIDLDDAFHGGIIAAANRRRLLQVWSDLSPLLGVLVSLCFRYLDPVAAQTAERHRQILDALAGDDNESAAAVVKDHYFSLMSQITHAVSLSRLARGSGEVGTSRANGSHAASEERAAL